MSTQLFRRGIPTEPDVIALNERFGVPAEGEVMPYEEVATVLHVAVTSSRFKTVTQAWRRQLEAAHGLLLRARDGAFMVRDPKERVMYGKAKTKQGVRCHHVAIKTVVGTDRARLSERERADCDKVLRIATLSHDAALTEARKRPTPQLSAVRRDLVAERAS